MRAGCRSILFALGALAVCLPVTGVAQVVVRQPRCTGLVVELQSLVDDIELVPGDLIDPPYVCRSWTLFPHIESREHSPIATLRILDRALVDANAKAEPDPWSIELMPVVPTSIDIRLDGGKGRFDFTGMPIQDLGVFATFTELELEFGATNRVTLESARITVQSGELKLHKLLESNAHHVTLQLPRSKAEVEIAGRPQAGEMELVVLGPPRSLRLAVPFGLPLRVEGPGSMLEAFAAASLPRRGDALESAGYATASYRVRLRFAVECENLVVRWEEAIQLPPGSPPEPAATAPAPRTATGQADARVARVLEAIESQRYVDAQAGLRELRQKHGEDPRLPVLERWVQVATQRSQAHGSSRTDAPVPAAADSALERLRRGQRFFLVGEYTNALVDFEAARGDPAQASDAEAWIRRTRSELQRVHAPEPPPPEPRVVEVVVTQTTSPVVALRTPSRNPSRLRSETLELAGQVGDDTGIDRLEVSLNGEPLRDSAGLKLQVRPAAVDSAPGRMPFTIPVRLRAGENEVVLTAYDTDDPQRWTSEHLVVTRLPPLWRTTPFLAALAAIAFGVLAWIGISRVTRSRLAFVSRYNPYVAGHPIRNSDMLFGRERLLRSILNTIHNNSIMLHGPRRIGKTSLLLELKRRLDGAPDSSFRFFPVFVDLQGTPEEQFFATLIQEILDACRTIPGAFPPAPDGGAAYSSREFTRDVRQVIQVLQARTDRKLKVVLLLDEVDALNDYSEQTNQKLRSVFMKSFAESLVAVMSGTHIEKRWRSEGSPWYNFFEEIEVRPLERADAVRLIRAPVRGIFSYDEAAVDRILRASEGRPYHIQRLCVHAINRVIDAKRRRVRVEDIEAVRLQAAYAEEDADTGAIGGVA